MAQCTRLSHIGRLTRQLFLIIKSDARRENFYSNLFQHIIAPQGSTALVIGIGSSVIALQASRHSAANIFVVEFLQGIVNIAQRHVEEKHLQHRIIITSVLEGFRCKVTPNFVMYEICAESHATSNIFEPLKRYLLQRNIAMNAIYPRFVRRMAVLIESKELLGIIDCHHNPGIQMQFLNQIKNSRSIVHTFGSGFNQESISFKALSAPILIHQFSIDEILHDRNGNSVISQNMSLTYDGTVHAIITYWEAYNDDDLQDHIGFHTNILSSSPTATNQDSWRSTYWGCGIQLLSFNNECHEARRSEIFEIKYSDSDDLRALSFSIHTLQSRDFLRLESELTLRAEKYQYVWCDRPRALLFIFDVNLLMSGAHMRDGGYGPECQHGAYLGNCILPLLYEPKARRMIGALS